MMIQSVRPANPSRPAPSSRDRAPISPLIRFRATSVEFQRIKHVYSTKRPTTRAIHAMNQLQCFGYESANWNPYPTRFQHTHRRPPHTHVYTPEEFNTDICVLYLILTWTRIKTTEDALWPRKSRSIHTICKSSVAVILAGNHPKVEKTHIMSQQGESWWRLAKRLRRK